MDAWASGSDLINTYSPEICMHLRMDLLRSAGLLASMQMARAQSRCSLVDVTQCVFQVRRVVPGAGCVWLGIPCSSWVFLLGAYVVT